MGSGFHILKLDHGMISILNDLHLPSKCQKPRPRVRKGTKISLYIGFLYIPESFDKVVKKSVDILMYPLRLEVGGCTVDVAIICRPNFIVYHKIQTLLCTCGSIHPRFCEPHSYLFNGFLPYTQCF